MAVLASPAQSTLRQFIVSTRWSTKLPVYSGPGKEFHVLRSLAKGTIVACIDTRLIERHTWHQLDEGGWISAKNLLPYRDLPRFLPVQRIGASARETAPRLLARGRDAFSYLRQSESPPMGFAAPSNGHVRRMTVLHLRNTIVVGAIPKNKVLFIQDDALFEMELADFARWNVTGALSETGADDEWSLSATRAFWMFCETAAPSLQARGIAVQAASHAGFWDRYLNQVENCLELLSRVAARLRDVYLQCPRLGELLIAMAVLESSNRLSDSSQRRAFADLILSSRLPDSDDWSAETSVLLGQLLKLALGGCPVSALTGYLTELGLFRLQRVAATFAELQPVWQLQQQVQGHVRGSALKTLNTERTMLALRVLEADGIHIAPAEFSSILRVSSLANVASSLRELAQHALGLHEVVTELRDAYESEML